MTHSEGELNKLVFNGIQTSWNMNKIICEEKIYSKDIKTMLLETVVRKNYYKK